MRSVNKSLLNRMDVFPNYYMELIKRNEVGWRREGERMFKKDEWVGVFWYARERRNEFGWKRENVLVFWTVVGRCKKEFFI